MGFEWTRDDGSFGMGFRRIANEQIRKAIAAADAAELPPSQRIHEARRRCKKLRGLLRLVRPDFPPYATENAYLRDVSRQLAEARDANVMRVTLAALLDWAGLPPVELAAPPADEDKERRALVQYGEAMRALQQRVENWPVDQIDSETLLKGLTRIYRDGRQARQAAMREPTDEAFHEWRKLAKYHWHHLNLMEGCAGEVLKPEIAAADELTEALGLHHDLSVLGTELAAGGQGLGVELDCAGLGEAVERRQAELEETIGRLGAQIFAETPKALKARFAVYLDACFAAPEAG